MTYHISVISSFFFAALISYSTHALHSIDINSNNIEPNDPDLVSSFAWPFSCIIAAIEREPQIYCVTLCGLVEGSHELNGID